MHHLVKLFWANDSNRLLWMSTILLDSLFDMEKATVIMTTSGSTVEMGLDDELSASLKSLWQRLGIQDLEQI